MQTTVKEVEPTIKEDLTARTCGMEEFRKKYCGNKSAEWVRTFIFDRYPETNLANGGWVLNPRKTANGKTTLIFLKPATKWLEKHQYTIDWNERLA